MSRMIFGSLLFLSAVSVIWSDATVPDDIEHYIHPKADLFVHAPPSDSSAPDRDALSPREAVGIAVPLLLNRGISNLLVCEVQWIAAPFPGYLIDALGSQEGTDALYSVFRLGIHDGEDEEYGETYAAGNEFVFLALGTDSTGSPVWFPKPGPDATPEEIAADADGFLSYEFLFDRDAFESLPARYPSESTED